MVNYWCSYTHKHNGLNHIILTSAVLFSITVRSIELTFREHLVARLCIINAAR